MKQYGQFIDSTNVLCSFKKLVTVQYVYIILQISHTTMNYRIMFWFLKSIMNRKHCQTVIMQVYHLCHIFWLIFLSVARQSSCWQYRNMCIYWHRYILLAYKISQNKKYSDIHSMTMPYQSSEIKGLRSTKCSSENYMGFLIHKIQQRGTELLLSDFFKNTDLSS